MTDYFALIHQGNADQFINLLVDRFPDIAIGTVKYWEKDGQVKRFYVNHKDGSEDVSFNLNITPRTIYVNDYKDIFWNEVLGVENMMEFKQEIEKLAQQLVSGY